MDRARLETALRMAISRDELLLVYQPQYRLSDGALDGAEALMRWRTAELGLISPGMFIPLAEETGEIVSLGKWALEEACRQAVRWRGVAGRPQRVAVNVSPMQLLSPGFVDALEAALKASGLEPQRVELEITESTFVKDFPLVRSRLRTLRELGAVIALDDFGTGYSSLATVRELPIDRLKIDRSFVIGLDAESHDENVAAARMLAGIIQMGHDLGKEVIVEGVETDTQLERVRELGCDVIQGYLLGRPIPVSDWEAGLCDACAPALLTSQKT